MAQAAEAMCPQAAIEIYLDAAKARIQQRGRGSHAKTAMYLTRVRDSLQKSAQLPRWTAFIAQIRAENRRLRVLRNELDLVGL